MAAPTSAQLTEYAMRVIQMVTQLEAGGAQRAAILLSEGLRRRGHDVETWFLYRKREAFIGEPGIQVLYEDRPSLFEASRLPAQLVRRLSASNADAVVSHGHYTSVLALPAAHLAGVTARVAVQQNPMPTYPAAARLGDLVMGALPTYTDIVAVSHAVAASAASYPKEYRRKMSVIHNAVSAPTTAADPEATLHKHQISTTAPLLVNVGRLHPQKNQATLLRAMIAIPRAHLVIIGEGGLRSDLQELASSLGISDRLHMVGELPWEEAMAISRSASVFVFPSIFEGMSLALVEAMTLGLPVVGSDIPPNREALGEAGLLVPPGNAEQLGQAIQRVLRDDSLRARMREATRRRAGFFSLQGMTNAYEALLERRLSVKTNPIV
jgi:glycosyltransferase involved in cell wall biosynthesis